MVLPLQKVKNQVFRVVALRPVPNPHPFRTVFLLDDFQGLGVLKVQTRGFKQSVGLVFASVDFVNGFEFEGVQLERGKFRLGLLGLLLLFAFRFVFLEFEGRDVFGGVFERSGSGQKYLVMGAGGP